MFVMLKIDNAVKQKIAKDIKRMDLKRINKSQK